MNGKFRTSLSGFNRQDVLDYLKKLHEEKAKLEDQKQILAKQVEEQNDLISELKADIEEKDIAIANLNSQLSAQAEQIEILKTKLQAIRDTYNSNLNNVKNGYIALNEEISTLAHELSKLSQNAENAFTRAEQIITDIDDIIGVSEDGSF